MIVTLKKLMDLGACEDGLDGFLEAFGTRAKVTRERLLLFKEHSDWVADNLFPERWAAYHKATRPHRDAFDEVCGPHWAAHDEATRPHWDALCWAKANALADVLGLPQGMGR